MGKLKIQYVKDHSKAYVEIEKEFFRLTEREYSKEEYITFTDFVINSFPNLFSEEFRQVEIFYGNIRRKYQDIFNKTIKYTSFPNPVNLNSPSRRVPLHPIKLSEKDFRKIEKDIGSKIEKLVKEEFNPKSS